MQLNLDDIGGAKELAMYRFYIVSVEDAKEQVETAREVVERVDEYLKTVV